MRNLAKLDRSEGVATLPDPNLIPESSQPCLLRDRQAIAEVYHLSGAVDHLLVDHRPAILLDHALDNHGAGLLVDALTDRRWHHALFDRFLHGSFFSFYRRIR